MTWCGSAALWFCHCVVLQRSLQLLCSLVFACCCCHKINVQSKNSFFNSTGLLHVLQKSALTIYSIWALCSLIFLISVKGWNKPLCWWLYSTKPHIYNVMFGPLSTHLIRNAVFAMFVRALCCCTAVTDSARWLCVSLSPLSLCPDQLEVTWLFSSLCPTSRCKVLLQSFPRTLQLHLSYTALRSRSSGKSVALKGPRRIFWSVDLSSEAGNYHRKEMKGLFE